jgi:polyvinyl alcohol dehydrogenase (cytochrome)
MAAGAALALCAMTAAAAYAAPSGEDVYRKRCASCHDQSNPRIPPREALQKMPARRILRTLDFGAMMTVAYPLSRDERVAVSNYLGVATPPPAPLASAVCTDRRVSLPGRAALSWNGWSPTATNDRYQPADVAGLTAADVPKLALKWAFGFEDDVTAFA